MSISKWWKTFCSTDAHPLVQFIKYGIAGGIATVVQTIIFFTLSMTVLPASKPDEFLVKLFGVTLPEIENAVRARNFICANGIGFIFSNFTAYVCNVLWVFKPGRHSRAKEIGLFYLVSSIAFVPSVLLGAGVIDRFGLQGEYTFLIMVLMSVMVNYACRKFLIFKG